MLDDTTRFVFTDALLSHPFINNSLRWGTRDREEATVGMVRSYLTAQVASVAHCESGNNHFDYRSFYHALKWELERLEREAGS